MANGYTALHGNEPMSIELVEVSMDSEDGMTCAGYMCIGSFRNRAAFEASDFAPDAKGPYRATEGDTFDIWADDPRFK